MIANLRFDRAGRPRFEPATNVRLMTVCTVANAVSEHLARLLDRTVAIDVFEPVSVPFGSSPALFSEASLFLGRGRRSDLLVVMRDRDARRLVACAFRVEPQMLGTRELSAVEEQVLERIAGEIAHLCTPLVGDISSVIRANGAPDAYDCATYFELRLAPPVDVVIGLGLTADPAPVAETRIAPTALAPVTLDLRARLGRTRVTARTLLAFEVGSVVTFDAPLAQPAALLAGNAVIAHGECGIHDAKLAFHVTSTAKGNA